MNNHKHWVIEIDSDHIIWLGMNRFEERVNTINDEVLDALNGLLHDVSKMSHAKGLVIHSLKKKGFIAGADIIRWLNSIRRLKQLISCEKASRSLLV